MELWVVVWGDLTVILHSSNELNRYNRLQIMMMKIVGDVMVVDDAVFVVKDDEQERIYNMTVWSD